MRDFSFSIDRGGTFTDVFAECPDRQYRVLKLLSEDPSNYEDAPREGIRRILEQVTGQPHPRDQKLDTSRIASIRMGTTVATNALLERKGERTALVVTKGFPDLLHIGNQSRPSIFDLEIRCPENLYETIVEVDELISLPLGTEPSSRNGPKASGNPQYALAGSLALGTTGEAVCIRRPVDLLRLREDLGRVKGMGILSLAVVLKHSAIYPEHERQVGDLARGMGFTQISLSSSVPMVKMVPRGFTAAADAYLTPHILRYLATFQSGFKDLTGVNILFMQSDGGLSKVKSFSGYKAILSGPAGGYVGYALTTKWEGSKTAKKEEEEEEEEEEGLMQVIGFDMGGTSTDVSRFAGRYEHVFETTTAGVTIQAPQLDINTVAAGGGSRLFFRSGLFVVGPESAGAHPGPVCYKKGGGVLAITDSNLILGRILPDFFPKIFGPKENEPLDINGTLAAFEALAVEVNVYEAERGRGPKTVDEIALGFIAVANEAMCRPIRALTQMKGFDVTKHVLACFGGAGGQHACAIARSLGMKTIFVHKYAGILSAVGIHLADIVQEAQEPCAATLGHADSPPSSHQEVMGALEEKLGQLEIKAREGLKGQGFISLEDDQVSGSEVKVEHFLNLRYQGTDVAVMTSRPADGDYASAFEHSYQREFGFKLQGRAILVDDVRVRATGKSWELSLPQSHTESSISSHPVPIMMTSACFEQGGRQETPVYKLSLLSPTTEEVEPIRGPAILIDDISTIVIEPGWTASITRDHNVKIDLNKEPQALTATLRSSLDERQEEVHCDPIQLAIFAHRFMGVAEQMGKTLQRTSISVNIKERLDFSCALFGPDGSLVANAPHLPVHLGAMSEAVRFQVRYYMDGPGREEGLEEGDVLLSNHPQLAGGSHLPDITAITPVFPPSSKSSSLSSSSSRPMPVFFVASRGHHADIGGISPGSMPPHSRLLVEEGAAVVSFKLVKKGKFDEEGISKILLAPGNLSGTRNPNISGTRNLADNLSDLRAQVAANKTGIILVQDLIREHGLHVVQAYMLFIQKNAEGAVREMLIDFSTKQGLPAIGTVRAQDQMDDGTKICLAVTIDRQEGSALFDFSGTGPEVYCNSNTPPAVTYSAIIYSLRCMVSRADIPLNQGCLTPIRVVIPQPCLLNPSPTAAVVGGNVLTSQRVTDVILKAFQAAAASQGCMNNLTFGDEGMGYYETIAGGAGAGPGWDGRSGVHTHMTNTRITDPEILERRYPVVLRSFRLREGSGGRGRWKGGEGVIRELEALRPISAGILSERRSVRPFGIQGGSDAEGGVNLLLIYPREEGQAEGQVGGEIGDIKEEGFRVVSLGGKATLSLNAGDRLRILTPGGGGYGREIEGELREESKRPREGDQELRGSVAEYKRRQEEA